MAFSCGVRRSRCARILPTPTTRLREDRAVIEFVLLCVAWAAFLVFVSRAGTKHLQRPHVGVTLPAAAGVLAALFEALPTCAVSPGFTLRTAIAVFGGVMAGRLFARLAKYWADMK